jgi:hypothetical protein
MGSSFTLLNLFNPTSQSPIWRAIAAPTIAPIPFAIKSIHEGSRPNKYWTNSIEPPKIITPEQPILSVLGVIEVKEMQGKNTPQYGRLYQRQ